MEKHRETHFFVLYSAHHQPCGHFIERADFRVVTRDDLFAWSSDMASTGSVQPLPLHCDSCSEDIRPTHLRIIKDSESAAQTVVPEIEIRKFNPEDWIFKVKEDL
jgi:hypothetical protein